MKHSTLFIDESGKSSLIDKNFEYFLLTGVILNNHEIPSIEGFFNYIKLKYSINTDAPFHSYDIFENPRTKITDSAARSLLTTIADFISLIPINIKIISVNKKKFKQAIGIKSDDDFKGSSERKEMKEYPYRIMSAQLFRWFARYLEKYEAIGQIIVDARRGSDYQLIKTLNLCKDPTGPLDKEGIKLIKEKCTAICFAEKLYLSGGLEITDLISYTSFFHVRRQMQSMENIKLNKVWSAVKNRMDEKSISKISKSDVKKFFKVGKDGLHKSLKD